MNRNLEQTSLRRNSRSGDPMQVFVGLPAPMRQWAMQTALKWSPLIVRRPSSMSNAKG